VRFPAAELANGQIDDALAITHGAELGRQSAAL
jgi:hypothetical protein